MIVFHSFNKRGGVERVAAETVGFLVEKGHEVVVVAARVEDGCLPRSVNVDLVPGSGPAPIGVQRFKRAASRAVVERHPGHALGTFGVFAPPRGLVWVQSVHARWIETSRALPSGHGPMQTLNPFHVAALRAERQMFRERRYRHLLALTAEVKLDLGRFYDVPAEDVTVLPNGYNPAEFSPERAELERSAARARLVLGPDVVAVLFVANESRRKGLGVLLGAVARLDQSNVVVVVVGKLDKRKVQKEAAARGLAPERLRVCRPSSDIASYFAAGDLFVLPTTYEAWGLVIVEALATGLPVITSRAAGASIAVSARSGLLLDDPRDVQELEVALANALRTLVGTPRRAVAAGVEAWAWHRLLREYEAALFSAQVTFPGT